MAKNKPPSQPEDNQSETDKHLQRISKLLALLAVKGEAQSARIATLYGAGFTPTEIAGLVGTTPNTVNVTLSQQKAARMKTRSKKKPKAKLNDG